MNTLEHAMNEFRLAGWLDENGNYHDEMQEMMCNHIIELLNVFNEQGHSGFSGSYAIKLFNTLVEHLPIKPLTGEDDEWNECGMPLVPKWQNKRCSRVFKDADGRAYDIQGRTFWCWYTDSSGEKRKHHFTDKDSRVYISFPYSPTTEHLYKPDEIL